MIEKIKDLRIRFVFQESDYKPPSKSKEDEAYLKGRKDGWNDCMAHLKACGKI